MRVKPPFSLKQYFFPLVHVAADPQYEPSNKEISPHFDVKVGVTKDEKNNLYQVNLEIMAEPENEDNRIPYSIHLICVGLFTVSDETEAEKLLRINGASLIYSAAREFLLSITARGPWQPVMLPTISFFKKENKDS
jgi:preprotein translocase subunit SecB